MMVVVSTHALLSPPCHQERWEVTLFHGYGDDGDGDDGDDGDDDGDDNGDNDLVQWWCRKNVIQCCKQAFL